MYTKSICARNEGIPNKWSNFLSHCHTRNEDLVGTIRHSETKLFLGHVYISKTILFSLYGKLCHFVMFIPWPAYQNKDVENLYEDHAIWQSISNHNEYISKQTFKTRFPILSHTLNEEVPNWNEQTYVMRLSCSLERTFCSFITFVYYPIRMFKTSTKHDSNREKENLRIQ